MKYLFNKILSILGICPNCLKFGWLVTIKANRSTMPFTYFKRDKKTQRIIGIRIINVTVPTWRECKRCRESF